MLAHLPASRFVRHLLFWAGLCIFYIVVKMADVRFYSNDQRFFFAGFFFVLLPIMVMNAYALAYWLLPFALGQRFGRFIGGLIVLILLIWALLDMMNGLFFGLIIPVLTDQPKTFIYTWQLFNPEFLNSTLFEIYLVGGFMAGARLFTQWYQKQQENQQLENQKLQTELQLLKLQLNPTFLFSSLYALHQLTEEHAEKAPEVVLKLAHFLRYILYESQTDRVPLDREIDLIDHYFFLQQILHPTNLEVSFSVRGAVSSRLIAPLSLFPVIQNAFSQLPAELIEPTWVSVDLAIDETHLSLKAVNEISDMAPAESTGLDGLRKQLVFYYPNQHQLQVWQEDRINVVTLTLSFSTTTWAEKAL